MVVEKKLKDTIQPLEEKITQLNDSPNVKNTYHMSLIHISGHIFTQDEYNSLLGNLTQVASNINPFEFSTNPYAFLDEDNDVGLNMDMTSPHYQELMTLIKEIPLPQGTQVKDYKPHITVYYGVKDIHYHDVKLLLDSYRLPTDTKYIVKEIGIGDLGEKNNLIRPIAKFPLASNKN